MLGAVEKIEGVGVQRAVGIKLQIVLGVGEGGRGVVLEGVNSGEKDVGRGFGGVECESFTGAEFGVGNAAERVLDESETVLSDCGRRGQQERLANEGFGLREFGTLIEDHGESEKRRGEVAIGEVDGFLEVVCGGVVLADAVVSQSHVVVGAIGEGSQVGGGLKIGEASLGVVLEEKGGALFKSARRFARQRKIVDRDNGVVGRSGGSLRGRR